jgi:hypothetical protein
MPAVFELTLDTQAPAIAWGAIAGAFAGELLRVAYTTDEPAIDEGTLRLRDGRQLSVSVLDDRLEVPLPPDTTSGPATLTVHVADELGNEADVDYMILLVGTTTIPTGPGRSSHPTWSPPLPPEPPRVVTWPPSRVATRSRDRVTVASTTRRGAVLVASRPDTTDRRTVRFTTTPSPASSRAGVDVAHVAAPVTATGVTRGRVVGRRDGRALEEALLLGLF